jgi:hypothetical protein
LWILKEVSADSERKISLQHTTSGFLGLVFAAATFVGFPEHNYLILYSLFPAIQLAMHTAKNAHLLFKGFPLQARHFMREKFHHITKKQHTPTILLLV